jgi:hypothetical protein
MRKGKGSIVSAQVVHDPMHLYGVPTTWAVMLHVQSPTGDSSDFLQLTMPCVSHSQACDIADGYNEELQPHLVGAFNEVERPTVLKVETPVLTRRI